MARPGYNGKRNPPNAQRDKSASSGSINSVTFFQRNSESVGATISLSRSASSSGERALSALSFSARAIPPGLDGSPRVDDVSLEVSNGPTRPSPPHSSLTDWDSSSRIVSRGGVSASAPAAAAEKRTEWP